MKLNKIFLASAIMCGAAAFITSCDDDLDRPPVIEPLATYQPNTKIADLKEAYWKADNNYYTEIGLNADGDSIIIAGRVISSDAAGNLYRQVIIEDETGAIDFAVTMNDINTSYYYGQEVRVNVTGMHFGKYSGLCRIGAIYNNGIGRMDEADFTTKAQVNRLPNPALVDTAVVTLDELATYKTTTEGLIRWQSRIIRLEKMTFTQGGKVTLGNPSGSSATNRTIRDASGKTIDVRTNDYSTLCRMVAPTGTGSVTAILSYFGSDWQLLLIDAQSLQGFDPTATPDPDPVNPGGQGDGSAANPFTASAVMGGSASGTGVWVTGYIVGCVDTSDSNNYKYQFSAPFNSASNLLLAATPTETNYDNCVPVQLSNGTTVRNELNLQNNPSNHGKQVTIQGNIEDYFRKPGVKSPTSYNWGATGGNGGGGATTENATFRKATSITSGKSYVMMISGKVGKAIASGSSYGRLELTDPASTTGNDITTDAANAITITAVTGGYTMVDTYGRYLSMDAEHFTSFQLYTSQEAGSVWTITTASDGAMTIENVMNAGCFVGRSGTYTNIAPAKSSDVEKPVFYEKVD